jgi:hypothetical protein
MDNNYLQLRVVYRDPPDLMELEVVVEYRGWSACSAVYASPHGFADDCDRLLEWSRAPSDPIIIEAGADTGIGWLKLAFYTIDRAGHVACSVTLATDQHSSGARPADIWRMAIEIRTELGLVENFARACRTLAKQLDGEAVLIGMSC